MGNLWFYAHPVAFWMLIAVAVIGIVAGVAGLYRNRQR
jgi:hypothetical protein